MTENKIATFNNGSPMATYERKGGLWRPMDIFGLPANLDVVIPPDPPDTTVVTIHDLLVTGETISTSVNSTTVINNAIDRLLRRVGPASPSNISTDHVTVDWEDTLWKSEDRLAFPSDTRISSGVLSHMCHNWPKGMKWQHGGIRAFTDDGTISSLIGSNGKYRDRYHIRFQQAVHRWEPENDEQWFDLEDWHVYGAHSYADPDYDVDREGQEAFFLMGQQWIRFTDCGVRENWADAWNLRPHAMSPTAAVPHPARVNDVYPGMVEILGGTVQRPGIMNMTLNQCRAPDGKIQGIGPWEPGCPEFWKNDPTHVNVPDSLNDAPSASGDQWGLWWHGNAEHPFLSIDSNRSIIDMEPIGSYCHIQDIRVGADSDKAHFRFTHPAVGGSSNFLSAGDGWGLMRRQKFQHIFRDGECRAAWGASTAVSWPTDLVAALSGGVALPTGTIHLNGDNQRTSADGGGCAIRITGLGWTLVNYTGKSGNDITGCTGGVGVLATNAQVRSIKNFHHTFGANLASGSNNVVLGAVGSSVGGSGTLFCDRATTNPFGFGDQYVRVWTDSGLAVLKFTGRSGNTLTGVTVAVGTGWTLKTGQAVTVAFEDPERAHYTSGDLEVLDFEWTKSAAPGSYWGASHVDGLKVTKCKGPYRAVGDPPFAVPGEINDVLHFDKGGTSQFGDNNFTPR